MKIISLDKGTFAFILGLLLWCSHMHANYIDPVRCGAYWQSAVSGTVSDASGPLPGVSVYVKGTSTSAISDGEGRYTIAAAIGDTLVFSFLGFKDSEQTVTSSLLDVLLVEDAAQLQEVVINAGYYSVRDKERTGSISRITAEDIESQPVGNIVATLQGRMPGVSITQKSGVPGGGFDILIRGQNSLRAEGNSPLYIVDGVPYSSESIGSNLTGMVIPGGISPLNSINPSNISSIEVLKDADATAIYGSRGANGVVLITTKKGREGKTQFSARLSSGTGRVTRRWDMLNTQQYLAMRREAFANDGIEPGPADYDVNGTWDQERYTDWQDVFIGGMAGYTDLNASVSGGSAQTRFLVSGTWHKETSVFPGDFGYKRSNVLSNLNHESKGGRFRLAFSSGYTLQENFQPGSDPTSQIMLLSPNAPTLYDSQGELNWEGGTWVNPLSNLEAHYKSNTADLMANSVLSYEIAEGLTAKTSLGFTDTRFEDSSTTPSTMFDPSWGLGSESSSIYVNTASRKSWIAEPQLSWAHAFGGLRAEVLAGATFQEQESAQLVRAGSGFTSNSQLYNLAAATRTRIQSDNRTVYRYQAGFGRINLSWKERYIVNLTGRRDGSSRFGPGRQFANFGAVGAAWLFSSEPVLSGTGFLSFGKLRASYGTSGNDQIGDYQFLDTYSSAGNNYGGVVGLEPSRLYNPDFGWETNRKFEVALEAGFLKDRIFFTGAYYRNRSSSQLVGIPLPGTTGFPSLQANLDATVQNSGWEFTLSSENIKTAGLAWSSAVNLTIASNRLNSFPGLEGSTYRNRYVIGEPLNIRKVYTYEGVDPQTGVYRFRDYDGDGVITASGDQKGIADLNPSFYGGIQNTLKAGQWQLDFLFHFVKQRNYSPSYSFWVPGSMMNQPAGVLDHWQQPGQGGAANQLYTTGLNDAATANFDRYLASDGVIEDASFLRLKNLSVSYTLPGHWIKGIQCRVFAEGQNLLTLTRFSGADPEAAVIGFLPPFRIITTGLNLTF